jgi:hypothetical protein
MKCITELVTASEVRHGARERGKANAGDVHRLALDVKHAPKGIRPGARQSAALGAIK